MKGDITRSTFKTDKHYNRVLMQQGRVQIDADWNEQQDIVKHRIETGTVDVIGRCGAPMHDAGFALIPDGNDLQITAGRYYVDGILCENEQVTAYTKQPDLPKTDPIAEGTYLAYLDVWSRHITALEDPEIREVALGGPDTATRSKTVWQVKLHPLNVDEVALEPACSKSFGSWDEAIAPGTGKLVARAQPDLTSSDPCIVTPGAGYRRLENQLYRVECHESGTLGTAKFKWSRDNGSIVTKWESQDGNNLTVSSIGRDAVLRFASGQWVELTDDTRELLGQAGTLVQLSKVEGSVLTIDPGSLTINLADFPVNPKIRRWDMEALLQPTNADWVDLEDGVQVQLTVGSYKTGDYWLIPARTATADVEWPKNDTNTPLSQLPNGIQHHYCRLALLVFDGEEWTCGTDCRDLFPPLTALTDCDLRYHKKHLHGWGIVCGLQVVCGSDNDDEGQDEGRNVTVREGYAIDCEGNDIMIKQDETVDVLEKIQEHDQNALNIPILDSAGNGEICLKIGLGSCATHYEIEPFKHEKNSLASLLTGTLLMDFYNDCIKNIVDFFKEQLTPPEDEKGLPVGPVQQRISALTNLVAQVANPDAGQHIYISPREHTILRDLYVGLRLLLQSETFCAMFENVRPFPDYPATELGSLGMDTIFSTNLHYKMRLRPRSPEASYAEAYTIGEGANPLRPSTTINRFDLKQNLLVAEIDPFKDTGGGDGKGNIDTGTVQDIAFSSDGVLIYMIASTRGGQDTLLRVGVVCHDAIEWRPLVVLPNVNLVTLATNADLKDTRIYAIGRGTGLYRIDPTDVSTTTVPFASFNAYGHLKITSDGRAFATAAAPGITQPTSYDRVQVVQLFGDVATNDGLIQEILLGATGTDDIAIVAGAAGKSDTLYSVVGPDNQGIKHVLVHEITGIQRSSIGQAIAIGQESSAVRMEPAGKMLLLTSEDGYSVRMIDMDQNSLVVGYLLPTQVGPIAISADGLSQHVYILNYASNTILTVPAKLFVPTFQFPIAVLAAYRKEMLEAFADLLGGFLQYLKDCLCDHFLVNCPDCTGDEEIYLACVSIRNHKVYKVCNFSKRRYVKSFPTVEYWLSLVPIIPLLDKVIEWFCCLILPDIFSRYTVLAFDEKATQDPKTRVPVGSFRGGISAAQGSDIMENMSSLLNKGRTSMGVAFEALLRQPASIRSNASPALAESNIVNQPIESAEALLSKHGVAVERVAYDPSNKSNLLTNLAGFFRTLSPGTTVKLHEEKGKVRYYSVSNPTMSKTTPLQSDVNLLHDQEIATLKQTVAELKAQVGLLVKRRSPEKR